MADGPLYQKHYYQINEIRGRQHCQIFTEIDPEIKVLSSRCTKGKFIEDAGKEQPLQPLHLVLSKPGGEMLTTQSLKWLNKLIQKELPEIKDFHFHCLRHHTDRKRSKFQGCTGAHGPLRHQHHLEYLFTCNPRNTAKSSRYFRASDQLDL